MGTILPLLVVLQLVLAPAAFAYIDPGSVSLFFQGIVAAVLGGVFLLKTYWQRVWDGVRRLFSQQKPSGHGG